MAEERERAAWLRAMTAAAHVVRAWSGEVLDPWDMIPENLRPPRPPEPALTPEQEAHQTKCALALIGEALRLRN